MMPAPAHALPYRGRGPRLRTLFYLLTVKPRLLLPLLWKSVKWVWSVKPLTFGLIGLVAFGVFEGYKNTMQRLAAGIRSAALHDAYYAHADQIASYEVERWYELYLDAIHVTPGWVSFIVTGRVSDLDAVSGHEDAANEGWIRFGPEPGGAPFFAAVHLNRARILADIAAWNALWVTTHPSRFFLPWAWGDFGDERHSSEPVASWRLRFLRVSEAVARYIGGLNSNPPRRSWYIRRLIASGKLQLDAVDAAKAEGHAQRPGVGSLPGTVSSRSRRSLGSKFAPKFRDPQKPSAEPKRISDAGLDGPVFVDRGFYVSFFAIGDRQREQAMRGENIFIGYTLTAQLGPLTELRRVLGPDRAPLRASTNIGPAWLVQLADGRIGALAQRDYAYTHAPRPGIRETLDPYEIEDAVVVVPEGVSVELWMLTNDERDRIVNNLAVDERQYKTPAVLQPGTRLQRVLTPDGHVISGMISSGHPGWLLMVNKAAPGLMSPDDYNAVRAKGKP